ncbi:hypothetical protein ACFVFS_34045 [Kitasatospora sp. NPDC057692]|uniref:hypothetical protein n=1 Tax=Kitasatospora sp. NPDC057692 TaxID=3346215 RepID=UPI0036C9B58A
MTRLRPGDPATPVDPRLIQDRQRQLRGELPRVRAAATAWRNGLAALLTALVGFGLIKGRSDIGQLSGACAAVVGGLLLSALLAGAAGALLLLRAAHGRPAMTPVRTMPPGPVAERREAEQSTRALRKGIVLTLACAGLLVAAVGTTWYGPARSTPRLTVITPGLTVCGAVTRVGDGSMLLTTAAGQVSVELAQIRAMQVVQQCSGN